MNLAQTQQQFRGWLHREAIPDFGPAAAPGLRVYQNNYRAQLAACLESSFPHTRSWIGDDAFHAAVVAHVDRVPPSSWTLDAYSRDFPDTLSWLHPADPDIAELATLERALGDVFIGPDAAPVTAAAAACVDWDRATLRLTPTLELHEATTNAAAIWTALASDAPPPGAEPLTEPAALLVWRQGYLSTFRGIDRAEQQALLRARAGTPFAGLCTALVAAHGESEGVALAGAWLGRWLADGLIIDIVQGDDGCAPTH